MYVSLVNNLLFLHPMPYYSNSMISLDYVKVTVFDIFFKLAERH